MYDKAAYDNQWMVERYNRYAVRLHREKDKDIIEFLEQHKGEKISDLMKEILEVYKKGKRA